MPITASALRLATATAAVLLAVPVAAGAATFSNTDGITIADMQAASPYPSPITVSGVTGQVFSVQVGITGLSHTLGYDVDMLLRGPSGRAVMLMSDQCGTLTGVNLTFADGGPSLDSGYVTGTHRPGNTGAGDVLPGAGGTATDDTLDAFTGEDPNGTWQLYVADDAYGDTGTMAGWSITIRTTDGVVVRIPASGTSGTASSYPMLVPGPDPGPGRVITGVTVTLNGLRHPNAADLDVLVADPSGQAIPLMSDACGPNLLSGDLAFSDAASAPLGAGPCVAGTYRPENPVADDAWPAPAPTPSVTTFAGLGRVDPRGTWRLYVVDDAAGGVGELDGATITATTDAARPVFFVSDTSHATEGGTATVRIARLGTPAGRATLDYTTVAGTAAAGSDFTATSGTLTFAPGEWTKRIQVPITADGVAEGQEELAVRISNATDDAAIDGPDEARIVIAASEGPSSAAPAPSPPSVAPAPQPATTPAPATTTPTPTTAPCAKLAATAKAACLRSRAAAAARARCLTRFPKAGARRTACLKAAAKLALPPAKR